LNTRKGNSKAQSAMEYLTTYGWAILIIAVVLGMIYELNLFNPGQFATQECILPADFNCLSYFLSTNGTISLNIQQATPYPVNITAIGCSSNATITNMIPFIGSNQVYLPISSNYTFSIPCIGSNGKPISISPGQVFTGTLEINYTDVTTGFPKTEVGKVIVKAS
jgi:hypothetical protein